MASVAVITASDGLCVKPCAPAGPIWLSPPVGPTSPGRETVLAESNRAKHGFPLGALKQGMGGAQIVVGETPPSAGETENGFRPQLRRGDVHEHHRSLPGVEQIVKMPSSAARTSPTAHAAPLVPMTEVERARFEALLRALASSKI